MRDRLIELIKQDTQHFTNPFAYEYGDDSAELFADHLLANGVIVPPCKVGDWVYVRYDGEVTPFLIYKSRREEDLDFITSCYDTRCYDTSGNPVFMSFCDYHIGKTVFLTKEEAEQALKEREQSDQ